MDPEEDEEREGEARTYRNQKTQRTVSIKRFCISIQSGLSCLLEEVAYTSVVH